MKKKTLLALAAAAAAPLAIAATNAPAAIVINEIDSDTFNTPATDYAEFIELFSTTGTATSLNNFTLVLFNGNGDTAYGVFDLDGATTDANGYYLLGTTSVDGANNTSFLNAGNFLQNGPDAVALYSGNFASGGAATTTNLVDAIVYGTGDAPDAGLLAALNETTQFDEGAATPPSDTANLSLARVPNGSGEFVNQAPTPGTANVAVPEPAALGVLALGGLLLARRRRK